MADYLDAAVSRIAQRQHRNITRDQLLTLGLSATAIRNRVRIGSLHRTPFPGVYTVGTPAITPHERAYAAILACGPTAILSHECGMTLNGMWSRWPSKMEVTITSGDRRPRNATVHRSRTLTSRDIKVQFGIPVTSPARTLFDMAPRLTDKQLKRATNNAMHEKILRSDDLDELVSRHPHHPSAARLAYFIDADLTLSLPEDEFPAFCAAYGIPQPDMGVLVNGRLADAVWPEYHLIAELDGWDFHNTRHDFEDDRRRDADNLEADIATIRITRRRMKREPARLAAQILNILANQGRRAA